APSSLAALFLVVVLRVVVDRVEKQFDSGLSAPLNVLLQRLRHGRLLRLMATDLVRLSEQFIVDSEIRWHVNILHKCMCGDKCQASSNFNPGESFPTCTDGCSSND